MEKEINFLWKQIHDLSKEVEEIEKRLENLHNSSYNNEEDKIDIKHVTELKEKINNLYEEKKKIRYEYNLAFKEYKDQQNLFTNAKLIAKRKQELINLRAKEEAEKNFLMKKCDELTRICSKILSRSTKEISDENPQNETVPKTKKGKQNKKKKQKKAEAIEIIIELDRLKEEFQKLGVAVPNKREDLSKTIKILTMKLAELEMKPISKSIPFYPHSYDVNDGSNENESNDSFESLRDLAEEFEHIE